MILDRRKALKVSVAGGAATLFLNERGLAEEDQPRPRSNRFLLYIHFGSICSPSAGLAQPISAKKGWPKGFFRGGSTDPCRNTNVNSFVQEGNMVFHSYLSFLREIARDMCLVNGDPVSLDHAVASNYQRRGGPNPNLSPEWAMGVAQFMQTDSRKNPMVVTEQSKTFSVPDINPIKARNHAEFKTMTRDVPRIPGAPMQPIWDVFLRRFNKTNLGSVLLDPSLPTATKSQLNSLLNGLPELDKVQPDVDELSKLLDVTAVYKSMIEGYKCAEASGIRSNMTSTDGSRLRESLILAGALAKSGLGNGMSISIDGGDLHTGGTDVISGKKAGATWAYIATFWKWLKSVGLDEDVMIVCGQEFGRDTYNGTISPGSFVDLNGKTIDINAEGRDHGKFFGTMFINSKVPKNGRIGFITENLVPVPTLDAIGTIDSSSKQSAYLSSNIVGSMLMRVFDDIFPTDRMVRKHWPSFVEIAPILNAK